MGCLTAIFRRIGGNLSASFSRIGGGTKASFSRIGGISATMEREGGISASMTNKGGITCRLGLVCDANIGQGILWASDGRLITFEGGYLIVEP